MSGGEIIDILCCWVVTGTLIVEPPVVLGCIAFLNAMHPITTEIWLPRSVSERVPR